MPEESNDVNDHENYILDRKLSKLRKLKKNVPILKCVKKKLSNQLSFHCTACLKNCNSINVAEMHLRSLKHKRMKKKLHKNLIGVMSMEFNTYFICLIQDLRNLCLVYHPMDDIIQLIVSCGQYFFIEVFNCQFKTKASHQVQIIPITFENRIFNKTLELYTLNTSSFEIYKIRCVFASMVSGNIKLKPTLINLNEWCSEELNEGTQIYCSLCSVCMHLDEISLHLNSGSHLENKVDNSGFYCPYCDSLFIFSFKDKICHSHKTNFFKTITNRKCLRKSMNYFDEKGFNQVCSMKDLKLENIKSYINYIFKHQIIFDKNLLKYQCLLCSIETDDWGSFEKHLNKLRHIDKSTKRLNKYVMICSYCKIFIVSHEEKGLKNHTYGHMFHKNPTVSEAKTLPFQPVDQRLLPNFVKWAEIIFESLSEISLSEYSILNILSINSLNFYIEILWQNRELVFACLDCSYANNCQNVFIEHLKDQYHINKIISLTNKVFYLNICGKCRILMISSKIEFILKHFQSDEASHKTEIVKNIMPKLILKEENPLRKECRQKEENSLSSLYQELKNSLRKECNQDEENSLRKECRQKEEDPLIKKFKQEKQNSLRKECKEEEENSLIYLIKLEDEENSLRKECKQDEENSLRKECKEKEENSLRKECKQVEENSLRKECKQDEENSLSKECKEEEENSLRKECKQDEENSLRKECKQDEENSLRKECKEEEENSLRKECKQDEENSLRKECKQEEENSITEICKQLFSSVPHLCYVINNNMSNLDSDLEKVKIKYRKIKYNILGIFSSELRESIKIVFYGLKALGLEPDRDNVSVFIDLHDTDIDARNAVNILKNERMIFTFLNETEKIIILKHIFTSLICYVTFENSIEAEMTQLVRTYIKLDVKILWLILAVLEWAKANNFGNQNTFCTTSLIWLVLFFLMTEDINVIPSAKFLPLLHNGGEKIPEIIKKKMNFGKNKEMYIKNHLELLELFFLFYSELNLNEVVLLTNSGKIELKENFKENAARITGSTSVNTFIKDPFILVHPFINNKNLLENISRDLRDRFQKVSLLTLECGWRQIKDETSTDLS